MSGVQILKNVLISVVAAVVLPFVLSRLVEGFAPFNPAVIGVTFVFFLAATLLAGLGNSSVASNRRPGYVPSGNDMQDDEENDDREEGTVKWFNVSKGFGFITRSNGEDVFVHFRNIRGRGHRSLTEGQRVRFNVHRSEKGLQAEDVSVMRV